MTLPTLSPACERLRDRLADRSATVAVIGLGYVGLPLVIALHGAGFRTIGLDIDETKIAMLEAGKSYLNTVPATSIVEIGGTGRFTPSADFARLADADAVLIAVPTPLDRHREPDLGFVVSTAERVAGALRAGQLIVLESTTYPGTTQDILKPILEAGGLVSGRDFWLAYSPEREDPGNADFTTTRIPKVVGGDGAEATLLAEALYAQFVERTVVVSSTETAEAVKLTENIFRAVNIALVNELKLVYGAMGIDVWEVIQAAKSKPFGYMPFYPGPGLGGHCIPIDPFYLTWKAREFDITTRFIELAGEINRAMPRHVVDAISAALDAKTGRGLKGAKIIILGIAYKKNVDDTRESPAFALWELLRARGAEIAYHDPLVPVVPRTREHGDLAGIESIALTEAVLASCDAVLIAADHDAIDYALVRDAAPLVIDTRNAMAAHGCAGPNVVKA
jgi:UDP-N-acetyl-D-glucosamine dehydrogenase